MGLHQRRAAGQFVLQAAQNPAMVLRKYRLPPHSSPQSPHSELQSAKLSRIPSVVPDGAARHPAEKPEIPRIPPLGRVPPETGELPPHSSAIGSSTCNPRQFDGSFRREIADLASRRPPLCARTPAMRHTPCKSTRRLNLPRTCTLPPRIIAFCSATTLQPATTSLPLIFSTRTLKASGFGSGAKEGRPPESLRNRFAGLPLATGNAETAEVRDLQCGLGPKSNSFFL